MADAFDEGFNAFYEPDSHLIDNPYDSEVDTEEYREWFCGYQYAAEVELKTRIVEYSEYFDSLSVKDYE